MSELTVAIPPQITGQTYYIRIFQVFDNAAPAFRVAPCAGGNAQVTITDATYHRYEIQAGTGAVINVQAGPSKTRVVPLAGATSITVRGFYNAPNTCESLPSTQTVAPLLPAPAPRLTTLTLQAPGGPATLAIGQLSAGYLYLLQRTNSVGGYVPVDTIAASRTSFPLGTVAANSGYRLFRTDLCGIPPSAESETLYPISLRGTSARNRNRLLFDDGAPTGTVTYTLTRNGVAIPATAIRGGLEDTTGECGTTYLYQITGTYPLGGKSVSNEFPVPTQSDLLPPQPRLLASFNERNVVVLTPLLATNGLPNGSTLYYRKASGGAPAPFITAITPRPARDSTALATLRAAPPCYSLRQADVCRNLSLESPPTCPALLSAAPADADGSTATLTWTAFTGPDPSQPARYVLQRLGPDFSVLSAVPVSAGAYTDLGPPANRQVLRYRLQISGAGLPAGTVSYSNIATVTRRLFLTIPTAFTPNGDRLNDVLEVKGKYLSNYTFVVVDRNGQEVFRGSTRADVWDGTIRGHAPVPGAYVWRFRQDNEDGTPFMATGAVTILK